MFSQGNVLKDRFKQHIKELHNVFNHLFKFCIFHGLFPDRLTFLSDNNTESDFDLPVNVHR